LLYGVQLTISLFLFGFSYSGYGRPMFDKGL
jgi:hypothetical protein